MANLLSERIAKLRKAQNLTQEQLGQLVGVSAQAVSKWEKGGAPDVELLPALADRLGVTIDGLFGRDEGAPQEIDQQMIRWIQALPQEQRLNQLFHLLAAILPSIYLSPKNFNTQAQAVLPTCYLYDLTEGLVWLRSKSITNEGMILGVITEDLPLFLLLPEPPEGYEAHFAPNGEYRKLFHLLSKEGCLELLLCLYHRKFSYYTASVLAKQAGLTLERVEGLLPGLMDCHLLEERSLELDDGPTKVYCPHDNHGLIPLLYFARWFMEESDGWSYGWEVRTRPILELTEEQIQRKRENEHETKR